LFLFGVEGSFLVSNGSDTNPRLEEANAPPRDPRPLVRYSLLSSHRALFYVSRGKHWNTVSFDNH
jgi:hypothetical protein